MAPELNASPCLSQLAGAASYAGRVNLLHPPTPGELLVARAGELDGYFDQAVVLILDRDESGTLGVCLHKFSDYSLEDALPGWSHLVCPPQRLFEGGPVSPNGAVCVAKVAKPDEEPPGWRKVFQDIGLLHLDTPTEIVEGAFADLRIFAGYAGWDAGQLENELVAGAWHRVPAREDDIFGADPASLWRRVLRRQGGELSLYSTWGDARESN